MQCISSLVFPNYTQHLYKISFCFLFQRTIPTTQDQDRPGSTEKDGSKSRSRSRESDPNRDQTRDSDRDRSRSEDPDQIPKREDQSNRDRSRSKSRDRSRDRSRSGEGDRRRDRSRDIDKRRDRKNRSRDRSRERSRSRGRGRRERSRSRERNRDWDRDHRRGDRYDRRGANWQGESEVRRRGHSSSPAEREPTAAGEEPPVKRKKEELDPILTRTGGAYIPPAKLRLMQQQITDKSSLAYQRMSWEALKKSINGLINKVNVSNIVNIIQELLQENIVRGRGLLARSVLQAQAASPIFTHVYAAVVAIINSKFPQIGELILKRLILNFRKSYRRNLKQQCLTASKFVAHLINQNVAHEVLSLEMLTLLLERPTDDSVEVAIAFLKECGLKLTEVSPRGINAIFERLRNVLHESAIDKRVQYMIEVMFAIRKDGFKDHPVIPEGLDLVDEDDQFTHMMPLEDDYNTEDVLNILDEGSSDSGEEGDGSDDDDDEEENEEGEDAEEKVTIFDQTEVNLVAFRRTIYLAIQSRYKPHSLNKELCNMVLDCCAQQRTYEKFFGLLAGRFCLLKKDYMESFEAIFAEQYETIHRLETNKLRNVARLFAHLLYTDSVPWSVLECVKMSEETTTSSSRIFVKILFQELCAFMGLPKLNQRLKDPTLQPFFEGLFPRDNPRNTRFAINFFTSIGLGGLTDELREHLKNAPKMIMTQNQEVESSDSDSSSSSSSSDSSSESSSDSSDSSSSSSSSDSDEKHKKKKGKQLTKKKGKKEHVEKEDKSDRGDRGKKRDERRTKDTREEKRDDRRVRDERDEREERRTRNEREEQRTREDREEREDRRARSEREDRDTEDRRWSRREEQEGPKRQKDDRRKAEDRRKDRDRDTGDTRSKGGDRDMEDTRERERNKENRDRNRDDRRRT
uniref:Pre-mRNA-splicing factor CWC22 homolog n=1 Tax=Periophthalmus magnuspinnatus TaxID=409849 RepID=A0A3B4B8M2_9GOBI